eukprot:tig00001086_g6864.t1
MAFVAATPLMRGAPRLLGLRAGVVNRPSPATLAAPTSAGPSCAARQFYCSGAAAPTVLGRVLAIASGQSHINELKFSFANGGEMLLSFSKQSPVAFVMRAADGGANAGGGGGSGSGSGGGGSGGGGRGDGEEPQEPREAKPAIPDDSMTRYPELSVRGMLRALDWFGTVVFALTGTVTAGKFGMDLLGCLAVGTITAVGGGTIRDMLLGRRVFWMDGETEYIWLSLATALATFFVWPELQRQGVIDEDDDILFWGDALGIGAFCVIGAQNGIRAGLPPILCVMSSMITSTFGGMTRDVLCRRPPRILHSIDEIYATTAIAGGAAYVAMRALGVPLSARIAGAASFAVFLRYLAWRHTIKLPTFDNHPGPQPVTHVPRDK